MRPHTHIKLQRFFHRYGFFNANINWMDSKRVEPAFRDWAKTNWINRNGCGPIPECFN